ncbi:VOC family protein [Nocardia australiensis]|uniref:VOC family protein n=1 Tax=Nocardia australiensis TaxID=2887191 RepID=UPI001D1403AC|nr:VOC family protein [Nocardia australiensis]
MSLHRLNSVTIAVPDVDAARAYYEEFGLAPANGGWLATHNGGRQLRIVHAPSRRVAGLSIGVDDEDDLGRIQAQLAKLDVPARRDDERIITTEPITAVEVEIAIVPRVQEGPSPVEPTNGPGRIDRGDARAPSILREDPVAVRKLGHVVMGSVDQELSQRFYVEGIGLKISDEVPGIASFMRCSTDHHNVLVQQAPVNFLHHTSWEVDDADEVGRGATRMLEGNPERHVWGMGRHFVGSNFFWYLKDPAGNFSEYYSDLDCIVEDALWKPGVWEGTRGLYSWGPPPPPSFINPEDLAALIVGAHSSP